MWFPTRPRVLHSKYWVSFSSHETLAEGRLMASKGTTIDWGFVTAPQASLNGRAITYHRMFEHLQLERLVTDA